MWIEQENVKMRRRLKFARAHTPALTDYGVTVAEAEAAVAAAQRELTADAKAGRLVAFKGKLRFKGQPR
jgi:hypothetical protein